MRGVVVTLVGALAIIAWAGSIHAQSGSVSTKDGASALPAPQAFTLPPDPFPVNTVRATGGEMGLTAIGTPIYRGPRRQAVAAAPVPADQQLVQLQTSAYGSTVSVPAPPAWDMYGTTGFGYWGGPGPVSYWGPSYPRTFWNALSGYLWPPYRLWGSPFVAGATPYPVVVTTPPPTFRQTTAFRGNAVENRLPHSSQGQWLTAAPPRGPQGETQPGGPGAGRIGRAPSDDQRRQ